ncbi:hypothetical protein CPB83DRAFT_279585 [Crepidotus variabilis]|uniref:GAT domain-containing protein n=1 Tax=Crepidotus variabilis TaxID=179855 RepID=A0A9P6EGB4_9AGAR|nr:hypothetical protein CPB83DRAFT_279585 [Crepidotus variabilis]
MFQPPQSGRQSGYEVPLLNYQEASPLPAESNPATPTPRTVKDRKSPSRGDRIIPRDEDIRRLLQECKIGQGNANVLSDALIGARPEDLKTTDVIKEFYSKCCASQELIYAQIPWATSIAEHSRMNKLQPTPQHARKRTMSSEKHLNPKEPTTTPPAELTIEEQLLAELLAANASLMDVLSQWQDLNRVAIERKVEHRSKKETRMERKEYESSISTLDSSLIDHIPPSRSHSPIFASPKSHAAPPSTYSDHPHNHSRQPSLQDHESDTSLHHQQNFAPPPSAPHGPRLPVPAMGPPRSRTPSPVRIGPPYSNGRLETTADSDSSFSPEEEEPPQPSAKALGKRRVVEPEVALDREFDPDDIYYSNNRVGQSSRESTIGPGEDPRWRPPQAKFVYDAVAERTRQLMVESNLPTGQHPKRVNGVH